MPRDRQSATAVAPVARPVATSERSGPLFDQMASIAKLSRAWDRVHANRGAAGGDGVSVAHFAHSADIRIRRLAHELRTGRYAPGPARRVLIPKSDGGLRPLDIPCVVDRVAQGAAAIVLDALLDREMAPSSFAYRRGRSVAHAVARVATLRRDGFRYVVDGDIVRYFERIPHERLILKLESLVDDPVLVDLVWLWLETYAPAGLGVPQGSPISPLLANLYLDAVDDEIESRGVRLVRFADDFLILCKSEDLADSSLSRMADLLARHGLELHREKTRLVDFDQGFRFLGHLFVRSMIFKEVDDDDTPGEDAIAAAEAATAAALAGGDGEEAGDGRTRAPVLRPLYVLEPGRRLEARGETLAVTERGESVLSLPPARIGRIELGPDTEATLAALDLAASNDVEVVRINGRGEEVARYGRHDTERARRHLAQARHHLEADKRLALARVLVEGRVRNQRTLLRQLNRNRAVAGAAAAAVELGKALRKLAVAPTVEACMGHEGEAARHYWPALHLFLPPGFELKKRQRRPAPDPVNMLLSVLSGLLARDVRAMALRAGLHPGFGALHAVDDAEDALVYDLVEEFRAPFAEATALALLNRKAVRAEHFIASETGTRLAREAWGIIIRGYEAKLAQPVVSKRTGHKILARALMLEQAHAYAQHCEGGPAYLPYLTKP